MNDGRALRRWVGAAALVALAGVAAWVAAPGGARPRSAVALCREVRQGEPLGAVVGRARAWGLDVAEGAGVPPGAVVVWSGHAPWRRSCVIRHRDGSVIEVAGSLEP